METCIGELRVILTCVKLLKLIYEGAGWKRRIPGKERREFAWQWYSEHFRGEHQLPGDNGTTRSPTTTSTPNGWDFATTGFNYYHVLDHG